MSIYVTEPIDTVKGDGIEDGLNVIMWADDPSQMHRLKDHFDRKDYGRGVSEDFEYTDRPLPCYELHARHALTAIKHGAIRKPWLAFETARRDAAITANCNEHTAMLFGGAS